MDDKELLSEAARRIAAMRKRVTSVCVVCGKPIEGTTRRKYCSGRCQVRAHRTRQREAQAGTAQGE